MKRKPVKNAPTTHIENCNFQGGVQSETVQALTALANAMSEQAKAAQMIAAALKGPDALLQINTK